jgi:hypothetical protein
LSGEFFPSRGFGLATAVLVVARHRRVVVARYPRYLPLLQDGDRLVGPRSVADRVPEVVGVSDVLPPLYIRQHCFEGGQIRVDVRDKGVLHRCLCSGDLLSIKFNTYPKDGESKGG